MVSCPDADEELGMGSVGLVIGERIICLVGSPIW